MNKLHAINYGYKSIINTDVVCINENCEFYQEEFLNKVKKVLQYTGKVKKWNLLFFQVFFDCIWASINLYFWFLGFVLSLHPQHGQKKPSHIIKILHTWHRFRPAAYLRRPIGFNALCLRHIPLQVITNYIPSIVLLANFSVSFSSSNGFSLH